MAVLIGLGLLLLWGLMPSSDTPSAEQDVERLLLSMQESSLENCRLDAQRREIPDPNDSDDMESMGFARMNTHVSMICTNGRINGNASTYRTRLGALWNSFGLTQCGVDYCQEAWASGRQAFTVTTIRF
ncbi:hypothetical protein C3942_07420 [Solimonas fluminis]|uniref:Uncharacterized protein n=2 Tax=Solimonas fluminis TaxID=2086571 RepID=A0A2S5THX7_9GAMM|nr:hypothetical protein C3942_07420 [Solimonas fluminis]